MEIARSNKRKFAGETGKCKEEEKQLSVDLVTGRPFFQQKIKLSKTYAETDFNKINLS